MFLAAAFGFLFTNQLRAALFENYVTYATGSSPEAVAIGDLNGDGRKDVAMTTSFYFQSWFGRAYECFAGAAAGDLANQNET